MQSRQHMQPGTASMHCNQSMYADRPIAVGYKRQRQVLREEIRMPLWKGLCTGCQGSTARKDGKVAHRSRSFCGAGARAVFCRK